ncbi:TolC family outer membrane protein [Teredinibacter franksiae]|uniref:TolC family outer membrane protein n=1 Tax=Teredinibacter franksiae TaxID=2761453 RepID=UPI00162913C3|nr:TolC family outer membrane protein [Teredinibacter franksiae]
MNKTCRNFMALAALSGISTIGQASTLEEIYQQALLNDHTFKVAQANREAGKESAKLGLAGLLPSVNAQAGWTDSSSDLTTTTNDNLAPINSESNGTNSGYSITLNQPLFDMAVWYSYQQAKDVTDIAEAQFRVAEQDIILRSAQGYFAALQAVDNLESAKAEENALSHQLEQTRQRFEVGLTAITEVHEAQAVFDSATAERLITEGRLAIAFEALEVITGRPHFQLSPLKKDLTVSPPIPAERNAWVDMAMEKNYNLKIASLSAASAKNVSKAAKSQHLPTLVGSYSYSDNSNESDPNTGLITTTDTQGQSIGVTLSVPIFNGGGVSAARRRAAQDFIAAREQLSQSQRDVVQATRSIYLTVTTSVATVKARSQAITSNQSALEATQAGYDVGTRDLVDVLNAQRNLYRAQRDYFDALYSYVLSTLQLKQVAGALSPVDVTELNGWLDTSKKVSRNQID